MKYKEPTAKLINCEIVNKITRTTLEFKKLPYRPAAPSWFGYVAEPNKPYIRLDKVVRREGNTISFETYDIQECLLQLGQEYTFRCLWTRNQLETAQSNPENWSLEVFKAADMLLFNRPDGTTIGRQMCEGEDIGEGVVVKNGWGHEHCELCFKKIAVYEPYEHNGYTNGSNWICIECYEKYICSGFGKKLGDIS
jgi:hypothetical protein